MASPRFSLPDLIRGRELRAEQRTRILWSLLNHGVKETWESWLEDAVQSGGIPDPFEVQPPDFAPWTKTVNSYVDQVTIDAMGDTIFEHGVRLDAPNWELPNPRAMASLNQRRNELAGVSDRMWEREIRPSLRDSIARGDSIEEAALRIQGRLDEFYTGRAETIARTTIISATNAATDEVGRQFGFGRRQWLATSDGRTRESHALANGQIAEAGEPFMVGGHQMRYPGDPHGPPEETINCRCTIIFPEAVAGPQATDPALATRNLAHALGNVQTFKETAARIATVTDRANWMAATAKRFQWSNARFNPLRVAYNQGNDAYDTMFEQFVNLFTGAANPVNGAIQSMIEVVKPIERSILHGRRVTSTMRRRLRNTTEELLDDVLISNAPPDKILSAAERMAKTLREISEDVARYNIDLEDIQLALNTFDDKAPAPDELNRLIQALRDAQPVRRLHDYIDPINERIHREADKLMARGRSIDHKIAAWVDDPNIEDFMLKLQREGVIARVPRTPKWVSDIKGEIGDFADEFWKNQDDLLRKLQREGIIARVPDAPDISGITVSDVIDLARQTQDVGAGMTQLGRKLQAFRRDLAGTVPGTQARRNIDNKIRKKWRESFVGGTLEEWDEWMASWEDPFLAFQSFIDDLVEPAEDVIRWLDDDLPMLRRQLDIIGNRFPGQAQAVAPIVRSLDELVDVLDQNFIRPTAQSVLNVRNAAQSMANVTQSVRGVVRTYSRVGEAYARTIDQLLDNRQQATNMFARILAEEGDATGAQLVQLGTRIERAAREGRLMIRDPIKYPADVIRGAARSLRHLTENTDRFDLSLMDAIGLLENMADTAEMSGGLVYQLADLDDEQLNLLSELADIMSDAFTKLRRSTVPPITDGVPDLPAFIPVIDDLIEPGSKWPEQLLRMADDLDRQFPFGTEYRDGTQLMLPSGVIQPERRPSLFDIIRTNAGLDDALTLERTDEPGLWDLLHDLSDIEPAQTPSGTAMRRELAAEQRVASFLRELVDELDRRGDIVPGAQAGGGFGRGLNELEEIAADAYRRETYRLMNTLIRQDAIDDDIVRFAYQLDQAFDEGPDIVDRDLLARFTAMLADPDNGRPLLQDRFGPITWSQDVSDHIIDGYEFRRSVITGLWDNLGDANDFARVMSGPDGDVSGFRFDDFARHVIPDQLDFMNDTVVDYLDDGWERGLDHVFDPDNSEDVEWAWRRLWRRVLDGESNDFWEALDDSGINLGEAVEDYGLWWHSDEEFDYVATELLGDIDEWFVNAYYADNSGFQEQVQQHLWHELHWTTRSAGEFDIAESSAHSLWGANTSAGVLRQIFDQGDDVLDVLTDQTVLFRGVDAEKLFGPDLDIDDIAASFRGKQARLDTTFMSTTFDPSTAVEFATKDRQRTQALMVIHISEDAAEDIPFMYGNVGESELVLPPGLIGTIGDMIYDTELDLLLIRVDIGDTPKALREFLEGDIDPDSVRSLVPALLDEPVTARFRDDILELDTIEFDRFADHRGMLALPEQSASTIAALEARDKARWDDSKRLLAELRRDLRGVADDVSTQTRETLDGMFDGEGSYVQVGLTPGRPEDEWFYERLSYGERQVLIKAGFVRPTGGRITHGADLLADLAGETANVDDVMEEWVDLVRTVVHADQVAAGNRVGPDVDVSFLEQGIDDFDPNLIVPRRVKGGNTAAARVYLTERVGEIEKRDAEWALDIGRDYELGPEPYFMSFEGWRQEIFDLVDGLSGLSDTQVDLRIEELIPPGLYVDFTQIAVDDLERVHHEIVEAAIRAELLLP